MPAPSDLVHETSATTGTGNFTLANVNGKRSFNTAFGNGAPTDVFDYYISNRDAAEWERGTGHMSAATTLVRDTVKTSSNSNNAVNFSAGTKDVTNDIPADNQAVLEAALPARVPHGFDMPINLGLAASVGSNLLTVAVKGANGSDPSLTNKVLVPFRNVTDATGTPSWLEITAALSIDTNATGATLGSVNSVPFRLWVVLFNNGGTPVLALWQAVTGGSTPTAIGALDEGTTASATAISGSATAAATFYSPNGTTITTKAYRIIGYLDYSTALGTAGTYGAAPDKVQLFGPGVKLPGDTIKLSSGTNSGTTAVNSTTQVQTGLTASITPTSKINVIEAVAFGGLSATQNSGAISAQISRGTSPTLIGASVTLAVSAASNNIVDSPVSFKAYDRPNTTSAQAYYVYAVGNSALSPDFYWNRLSSVCLLDLREIMV